jgi:hypothetical protein
MVPAPEPLGQRGGLSSDPVEGRAICSLRLPDHSAERRREADPSQSYAGDPDHRRRARRLGARAWDEARAL